jgi:hypothetical protein
MESIIISAVGSAKTRHGDADDAFSWQIQFVESFGTDQKCQGGIQTTGNTDYYSLAVSVYQTFGKPCYLDDMDNESRKAILARKNILAGRKPKRRN